MGIAHSMQPEPATVDEVIERLKLHPGARQRSLMLVLDGTSGAPELAAACLTPSGPAI